MSHENELGSMFGHYRIEEKLGEGGMGEVYLAEDTRLFRKVALKILPRDVASRSDRMLRFEQEARAASALNHPNILTIYEIGDLEGIRFIATEFVDGVTLRDRLHSGGIGVERAIDMAIQIASALAAAHEAGIVHRDIKPENIMVRRDGLTKVLDFGLAKLATAAPELDPEGETRAQVRTEPGVIMGTVRYMSPEQARGKDVDSRTDIWSLACVLYEMVSGRPPFVGETTADLIAEIVKAHPSPLTDLEPAIPERLDEIVAKCLEKDREERYQVVKDLAIDLRRLKRKLDLQSDIERSATPERENITRSGFVDRTSSVSGGSTISVPHASTISSAQLISGGIRAHRWLAVIVGLVILSVLTALGYLGYRVWNTPTTIVTPSGMKITRLTTDGTAGAVSISKDGRYVVHAAGGPGARGLWIRQTTAQSAQQIVPNADGAFIGTTFTPNNDFVYYAWRGQGEASATLYSIPTLGGTPTRIIDNVYGPVTFSPDGKQIAFVRREVELVTANADGSNERTIKKFADASGWFSNDGPAWSPDAKIIAVSRGSVTGSTIRMTVAGFSPEDGTEVRLTAKDWQGGMSRVAWLADGSGLIVNAYEASGLTQVWLLSLPSGDVRRITNDLKGYGTFSLGVTGDGSVIATVDEDRSNSVWSAAPGDDDTTARQLNSGKYDAEGVALCPDGRILFKRSTGETTDIWIMNADGSNQRRLTNDENYEGRLAVTPDGRHLVFERGPTGSVPQLWKMALDGSELTQLTFEGTFDANNPHISPDGKWIVFNSWRTGVYAPYRMSIDGGEQKLLYDGQATVGPVSPDNANVLVGLIDSQTRTSTVKLALIPLEAGGPIRFLEIPTDFGYVDATWSGDLLYALHKNNVHSISLSTGKKTQLTKFKTQAIFPMAASPDGKRFILSRGTITNDVVLIREFR